MASSWLLLFFALLQTSLLFSLHVKADDEDDLVRGINSYRTTLNLPSLTENDNAECLADEIADQFKNQPCTNTTGANTVPGTEKQFSNYPDLLTKCRLNITNTRDGVIMPACVPNQVPSILLSNFTQSQYSGYLNNSKYTGYGIGSEDDWVVIVLTTSSTGGSFTPADNTSPSGVPSGVGKSSMSWFLCLVLGLFVVMLN